MVEAQVAFAVVGHCSRQEQARDIAKQASAPIEMDSGDRGSLVNHDLAWRTALRSGSEWVGVLEDDVELVDGFLGHAEYALSNVPNRGAVSLYTGSGRPRQNQIRRNLDRALTLGTSWFTMDRALWGPALILPAECVDPMLDHVADIDLPYDQRLSRYLIHAGIECHYSIPSLVDHLDGKSLLSDDSITRKAHNFGSPTGWNSLTVRL